jgi:manganese/zinc/iron transport system permease protein
MPRSPVPSTRRLKLSTFDSGLAAALGFHPALVQYAFMSVVSITAVGAFDAVGSILVVALMIAPPAAARLLTHRLPLLLLLSAGIAAAIGACGFQAVLLDASIAGCMAVAAGGALPPRHPPCTGTGRGGPAAGAEAAAGGVCRAHAEHPSSEPRGDRAGPEENRLGHLPVHLRWTPEFALRVARHAEQEGLVTRGRGTACT